MDEDLTETVLFLGLPLPLFGTDGDIMSEPAIGDCVFNSGVPLIGAFDGDRAFIGVLRLFLGVPLTFFLLGDVSSPAFKGTFVVNVFSLKIFDGEQLGTPAFPLDSACSAWTVMRICQGLSLGSSNPRLLLGDLPFDLRASGVVTENSWACWLPVVKLSGFRGVEVLLPLALKGDEPFWDAARGSGEEQPDRLLKDIWTDV